jgi:predicted transcriptional regulator
MTIAHIADLLDAAVHCGEDHLDCEVRSACGCDMMSDALAFMKEQSILMTGLVNPQVIRTAEMMDVNCIVFVRGKEPTEAMIELARERGLVLLSTRYRMFPACGILYVAGLEGNGKV